MKLDLVMHKFATFGYCERGATFHACNRAHQGPCRRNVMLISSCLLLDVLLPLIASPTCTRCHPKCKHWHGWL